MVKDAPLIKEIERVDDNVCTILENLGEDYWHQPYLLDMVINTLKDPKGQPLNIETMSKQQYAFYQRVCRNIANHNSINAVFDPITKTKLEDNIRNEVFYSRGDWNLFSKLAAKVNELSQQKLLIDNLNCYDIILNNNTKPLFDIIDFEQKPNKNYLLCLWW